MLFIFIYRGSKIPNTPYTAQNGNNISPLTNVNLQQQQELQQTPTKQSMLGKLKIFSNKDKQTECPKTQLSKRTSSSSGFSSARSERSDSSLSLNNETNSNIPTSQSSSSNKSVTSRKSDASKVTTKISKVPAPTAIKTKGDNKQRDKSQLNNNQINEAYNNGTNGDISPTKMHKIPQAKLQVPGVGRKSADSKTGLTSQQQAKAVQQQLQSVSTAIPKPMAAIKGTTKQQTETILQVSSDDNFDVIKVEKVSISVQNNNEMAATHKTQIVNPLMSNSPLHNQLLNQTNNNNITSTMTDSVHLTSTSIQSESSVIYRPTNETLAGAGSLHHADIYQLQTNLMSNRKLENFNDPFNGNKFGTMPMKVSNGMVQTSIAATIIEEDREVTSTMVPMRSLMRGGFNNQLSSPSRLNHIASNGYYDENGQGYCSDDQSFRKNPIRYSEIENGYLSEGPHFLSMLRNSNRTQLPSTIAEER